MGPAYPLPKSLYIMLPGLALLGIGTSAVQVISLTILRTSICDDVKRSRAEEGKGTSDNQLTAASDKAAALFNMALAFGNILAPILGGWLVDKEGF